MIATALWYVGAAVLITLMLFVAYIIGFVQGSKEMEDICQKHHKEGANEPPHP